MNYQQGLPVYTPSSSSPNYSHDLAHGESLLEYTPSAVIAQRAPTSLFIKKDGKTTVILYNQFEGAEAPVYGRGANVTGHLLLEQADGILEVLVKIKGTLHTTISDGSAQSQTLDTVNIMHTLWTPSRPQDNSCPEQLSFLVSLPTTFDYSGSSFPLPPTYHVEFISSESLFLWTSYTLHFTITRVRHKKVEMWTKTKNIPIVFKYVPRTRPHRPILTPPDFFSSIKTSPEEWHQSVAPLQRRPNAETTNDQIYCHLFVPSSRVYGFSDTIPFHIQLTGSAASLKELFSKVAPEDIFSTDPQSSEASSRRPSSHKSKPLLTISMIRQVSSRIRESKQAKSIMIGESRMWPVPPDLTSSSTHSLSAKAKGSEETHVDWEGEIRCQRDVTVGGFDAANVQVKDFITLVIAPPNPQSSPILPLQITVPIRLVTESWGDVTGLDSGLV